MLEYLAATLEALLFVLALVLVVGLSTTAYVLVRIIVAFVRTPSLNDEMPSRRGLEYRPRTTTRR